MKWDDVLKADMAIVEGQPGHLWIQWKGTAACVDIHCVCGEHLHFDGEFLYAFQCPCCKRYFGVGSHIRIYELDEKPDGCCQYPEKP